MADISFGDLSDKLDDINWRTEYHKDYTDLLRVLNKLTKIKLIGDDSEFPFLLRSKDEGDTYDHLNGIRFAETIEKYLASKLLDRIEAHFKENNFSVNEDEIKTNFYYGLTRKLPLVGCSLIKKLDNDNELELGIQIQEGQYRKFIQCGKFRLRLSNIDINEIISQTDQEKWLVRFSDNIKSSMRNRDSFNKFAPHFIYRHKNLPKNIDIPRCVMEDLESAKELLMNPEYIERFTHYKS